MKTADEIEVELQRRFEERIYVGMGNTQYLREMAAVLIRYVAEEMANTNKRPTGPA